jgi:hypothetical protein
MMNMIELQNKLKNFSQEQLVGMMQQPSGDAPQFMVLGEITRRQKMQQEATKAPTQSVAQEAVSAAGVPQGGIADMARTLAPQTDVAQNTGVMSQAPQGMPSAPQGIAKMASGGVIKMQAAGKIDFARYRELARRLVSDKRGGTLTDSFSPEERKELDQIKGTAAFREAFDLEMRAAQTAEYELANPDFRRVESSAPTPVFDATVEAPSLNQAPAADIIPVYNDAKDLIKATYAEPTYDSAAPQMPVPPKTDSMPQGPRPSTTGSTQVNIAGNIYAVLGDGSVVDQMGRTPPPPVAELARQKAGTPAAQFTTQQQFQDAQNLANRIGANSGENAVLPSENLLMGGGREGTPYLNTPAADTAIYAGGYDPQSRAATSTTGLAALSQETMPTVGGPDPRGGLDIQSKINRLRAIIESNASPMERMQAAQELEKLNDSVAMTQGYLAQQETTLPPGYIMTAMGMQLDPNYVAPGTTGNSIIDQTVTQGGSAALSTLPAGIQSMVDSALLKAAQNKANLTDFEKGVYPINQTKSTATDVLDNPFAPKDLKIEAQKVIDEAAKKTEALASKTGMNPELFSPRVLNETGYSGLTEYDPTATLTPTAASVLEKSALAAELTGDMKPKPRPKDLFAPTTDNALGGGGSGTGSGSGSGGSSNYETKLLEMLSRQEANAKSDKWMALAQAGMSLMQGGTGSFGGDLGRAGQTGLAALQGSRASNDKSQLDILGAIENSKLKREAIAASAAKSTAPNATALKSVIENLDIEMAPLAARAATGKLTPDEKTQLDELKKQRNYYVNILGGLAGGGNGAYPASPTPKPPYDATKPPGIIGRGINAVRDAITG